MRNERGRKLICERGKEHDNKWTESGLVSGQLETFEGPADLRQGICRATMHQDLQLHYFLQMCRATWVKMLLMQLRDWPRLGTFAYQMPVKQKDEGIRALKLCRSHPIPVKSEFLGTGCQASVVLRIFRWFQSAEKSGNFWALSMNLYTGVSHSAILQPTASASPGSLL